MTEDEKTLTLIKRLTRVEDSPADLQGFLDQVVSLATEVTAADGASLMLLDREEQNLIISACHGVDEESMRRITFRPGEGIAGRVLETGEAERFEDVIGEPQFVAYPWQEGAIHALLVVPIRTAGRMLGVISCHAERRGAFGEAEQVWLELVSRQVASDLENAWLRERSCFDPLTRVYNKSHCFGRLQEEVKRARRHRSGLSLLAIDIDRFTTVNEIHGTFVGDMVLREFARRVADEVRGEDLFARWTSEKFVLLLPHTDAPAAEKIAERIRFQVSQRAFKSRRGAIPLTVSIGVATMDEDHPTAEAVLERCQRALIAAKRGGGDQVATPDDPDDPGSDDRY